MYIDLDRIGQVNHAMGRELGDRLLEEAASRVARALGPRAIRARLAPDDFLGLVEVEDFQAAAKLALSLLEQCRQPYVIDCLALTVTASIGFALFPSQSDNAASLLGRAEHCLYRAKIAGRNCFYPGGTTSSGGMGSSPKALP